MPPNPHLVPLTWASGDNVGWRTPLLLKEKQSLRRSILIAGLVALLSLLAEVRVSLAAPQASLEAGADGKVRVVGDGWHPGDQLALTLGGDRFEAYVDSGGGFEVPTGLAVFHGALAVRHMARMERLSLTTPPPHPLAVWFAQSMLSGAAYAGALLVVAVAAQQVRRRRYAAPHDSWPRSLARPARRR